MIRYNPGKDQFMVQSTEGQYVEFRHMAVLEKALRDILEELSDGSPATAAGRRIWKIAMRALEG